MQMPFGGVLCTQLVFSRCWDFLGTQMLAAGGSLALGRWGAKERLCSCWCERSAGGSSSLQGIVCTCGAHSCHA
jgi:hypothetical protein